MLARGRPLAKGSQAVLSADHAPGPESEHEPPGLYGHLTAFEFPGRRERPPGELAVKHPERYRRPVEREVQYCPRVLGRRLRVVVLEQVAACVRDLEIAVIVCAAVRPRHDVVDVWRQGVIGRPPGLGLFHELQRPVRITGQDRLGLRKVEGQLNGYKRFVHRAGGVAADAAYPAVSVAEAESILVGKAFGHTAMLMPASDSLTEPVLTRQRAHALCSLPGHPPWASSLGRCLGPADS